MALAHCQRFRAQLPALYNQRRQFDRPIPSLFQPVVSDAEAEDTDNETAENNGSDSANENDVDDSVNASVAAENSVDSNHSVQNDGSGEVANDDDSESENNVTVSAIDAGDYGVDDSFLVQNDQNDLVNGQNQSNGGATGSNEDVKQLHNVPLNPNDEIAINSLFDEEPSQPDKSIVEAELTLGVGETARKEDGKTLITKVIVMGDLEMTYTYGEKPKPLQPLYQVKMNDAISENIPFKENVS